MSTYDQLERRVLVQLLAVRRILQNLGVNLKPINALELTVSEILEQLRDAEHAQVADAGRVEILREIVGDYDRRRSTLWGRFLLRLLQRTT